MLHSAKISFRPLLSPDLINRKINCFWPWDENRLKRMDEIIGFLTERVVTVLQNCSLTFWNWCYCYRIILNGPAKQIEKAQELNLNDQEHIFYQNNARTIPKDCLRIVACWCLEFIPRLAKLCYSFVHAKGHSPEEIVLFFWILPIFCHLFIRAFLGNEMSLFPRKCQ